MSDRETDDELAYRLGTPLGMDYFLTITHPIVKRPTNPPIIVTSNPGGPAHTWVREHFIQKGHTMNDQTTINLDWKPNDHDPAARRTDLATSHAAAASVKDASTIRARVWVVLRSNPEGLTHEQLVEAYRNSVDTYGWTPAAPQSIRSRTKELERDGMVRRNERATDKTKAGRLTHRWFAITDPGEQKRRREATESTKAPTPERTASLVEELTLDIQESRRVGLFHSDVMAQFLVDRGWTKNTPEATGR